MTTVQHRVAKKPIGSNTSGRLKKAKKIRKQKKQEKLRERRRMSAAPGAHQPFNDTVFCTGPGSPNQCARCLGLVSNSSGTRIAWTEHTKPLMWTQKQLLWELWVIHTGGQCSCCQRTIPTIGDAIKGHAKSADDGGSPGWSNTFFNCATCEDMIGSQEFVPHKTVVDVKQKIFDLLVLDLRRNGQNPGENPCCFGHLLSDQTYTPALALCSHDRDSFAHAGF
jgi:hypothetical protein